MEQESVSASDNVVTEFSTYEDFLDSQITPLDLFYLEVKQFALFLLFKISDSWLKFSDMVRHPTL